MKGEYGKNWYIIWKKDFFNFCHSSIPDITFSLIPLFMKYSLTIFCICNNICLYKYSLSLNLIIQYGSIWNIHEHQRKCERRVPLVKSGVGFKGQTLITCYARDFLCEKSQSLRFMVLVSRKGNSVLTLICKNLDTLRILCFHLPAGIS